jgi:phosphatidylserine/phosphatidylglycerophosphate/cardiolipin synthase-like enzyme
VILKMHIEQSSGIPYPKRMSHMRKLILLMLLFLLVPAQGGVQARSISAGKTHSVDSSNISVYFSPHGGCTEAVVQALDSADSEVLVQAYSFTSAPIAKALVEAHKRGVKVEVILDKSQRTERYSSADFLAHAGIPTYIDAAHAIAHNKVMVIDRDTVVTGSFNFTKAAETRNAENLLVIRSAELADKYRQNWNRHLKHSERYWGR